MHQSRLDTHFECVTTISGEDEASAQFYQNVARIRIRMLSKNLFMHIYITVYYRHGHSRLLEARSWMCDPAGCHHVVYESRMLLWWWLSSLLLTCLFVFVFDLVGFDLVLPLFLFFQISCVVFHLLGSWPHLSLEKSREEIFPVASMAKLSQDLHGGLLHVSVYFQLDLAQPWLPSKRKKYKMIDII